MHTAMIWNVAEENGMWLSTLSEKVREVSWSVAIMAGRVDFDSDAKGVIGFSHKAAFVSLMRNEDVILEWLMPIQYAGIEKKEDLNDCLTMVASLIADNIGDELTPEDFHDNPMRWMH